MIIARVSCSMIEQQIPMMKIRNQRITHSINTILGDEANYQRHARFVINMNSEAQVIFLFRVESGFSILPYNHHLFIADLLCNLGLSIAGLRTELHV